MAARNGNNEMAKHLLDAGADKDVQGRNGWTALHEACHASRMEVVQTLIVYGADVMVRAARTGAVLVSCARAVGLCLVCPHI